MAEPAGNAGGDYLKTAFGLTDELLISFRILLTDSEIDRLLRNFAGIPNLDKNKLLQCLARADLPGEAGKYIKEFANDLASNAELRRFRHQNSYLALK